MSSEKPNANDLAVELAAVHLAPLERTVNIMGTIITSPSGTCGFCGVSFDPGGPESFHLNDCPIVLARTGIAYVHKALEQAKEKLGMIE